MVLRTELAARLVEAFLDNGYTAVTMTDLAAAVAVTRRTMYNHFKSKEEALRLAIEALNAEANAAAMAKAWDGVEQRREIVDLFVDVLDSRYGVTRRRLARSAHATDLNAQALGRCSDLMVAAAIDFQQKLAALIETLEARGLLRLKPGIRPDDLAWLLADGARGINQSLPPVEATGLYGRYRVLVEALLHGVAAASGPGTG